MKDEIRPTNDPRDRLDQLRGRKEEPEELLELEEEEDDLKPAQDDGRCYSNISAGRQLKPSVIFRFIKGNAKACEYSYLVQTDWDGGGVIKMDFSGSSVTIEGRNLEPIFYGLAAHRTAWVREIDDLQARANLPKDAPVVTKINVTEAK
jgi:hypothetical protein